MNDLLSQWTNFIELLKHLEQDHHWSGDDPRWMQSKTKLEEDHQAEHQTSFPHEEVK